MDAVTQFLNSIPGFQGSMQTLNRNNLAVLQANGMGDAWWIPGFIAEQQAAGWL
ncbi:MULTISPECIES: hypothetical protein [Dietzia]|uniref:Uncharacterized protein n=1 Tax=Dietzia cinnamea TaxID=321318 RepID=A0AAW5QAQ3_9ACTN|nr:MULTISPECIES: hypothetical protein [Dietzia]MBM7232140.1 hypothetical protein [Dietzia cinnamea]MCT1865272.1 hypothetical protein [Dietzia cinnamea]MCT2030568.1 hypothetical protein [Dietzia cinnamea]MCT2034092.1 hypothetical protein [Dietzia cinnamea]MCT2062449.1 hypothetical protein [Dietzia cinnamea]